MKIFCRNLIILLAAIVANSVQAQTPPQPSDELLEHWRRSTVAFGRIETQNGKQEFHTIGSGVLIASDQQHGCLLTAKHVFGDLDLGHDPDELKMRVPQTDVSSGPDFGISLSLKSEGKALWKALDDGSDLAVFPLPDLSVYKDLHAVSLSDFGTSDDDVYQGASVIVLGYPGIFGAEGERYLKFGPIARSGVVAWINPTGRLNNTFLVDANLYPGNSGGPVFHVRSGLTRFGGMVVGGGLALIGIVSQGANQITPLVDTTTGKPIVNPATGKPAAVVQVTGVGGLSVIQPASKARRLAEQLLRQ